MQSVATFPPITSAQGAGGRGRNRRIKASQNVHVGAGGRLIKVDALPRSAGTCHLGQEATEIDKRRSSLPPPPCQLTLPPKTFT